MTETGQLEPQWEASRLTFRWKKRSRGKYELNLEEPDLTALGRLWVVRRNAARATVAVAEWIAAGNFVINRLKQDLLRQG